MKKFFHGTCLLFFKPVLVAITAMLMHKTFPGFWEELIALVGISAVTLIIATRDRVRVSYESKSDEFWALRNLLIIITASIAAMILANNYNTAQQQSGIVLWVIGIVAAAIIIVAWKKDFSINRAIKYNAYFPAVCSCVLFVIGYVFLSCEMYMHFGTHYIYLPAIALTFLMVIFANGDDNPTRLWDEELAKGLLWLPASIALISIVAQFWAINVVFGLSLIQVLGIIGALAFVVGAIIFIIWWRRAIKREKLAAALKKEQKDLEEKERLEEQLEKAAKIDEIMQKIERDTDVTWDEIIFILEHFNYRRQFCRLPKFSVIYSRSLTGLIQVSHTKKSIVFGSNFNKIISYIDSVFENINDDQELDGFLQQLKKLFISLKSCQDFTGYKALKTSVLGHEEIKKLLPNIE